MEKRPPRSRAAIPRACVALSAVAIIVAPLRASSQGSCLEIISPSHPDTVNVSGCPKVSQHLSWDDKKGKLEGIITYSKVVGAGDQQFDSAKCRTFILEFPTIQRSAHGDLYVQSTHRKVAIGHLEKGASGQEEIRTNSGVGFVAHRVEGRLGGEIIVSPTALTTLKE